MGFIGERGISLLRSQAMVMAPTPFLEVVPYDDTSFASEHTGTLQQRVERIDMHGLVMQLQDANDMVTARISALPALGKLQLMEALNVAKEEGKAQELTSLGSRGEVVTAFRNAWPMVEKDMIQLIQQKDRLPDDENDASKMTEEAKRSMALVYDHYFPPIVNYLRRRGVHNDAVDDFAQEVFGKVWNKIGAYRERGLPFSAWLYRLAHNHMVDQIRAGKTRHTGSIDEVPETAVTDQYSDRRMEHVGHQDEIASAMTSLTFEQRRVVELRFLEGYTTGETAAFMGKTEDSVKKLQARGLAALRRTMLSREDIYEGKVKAQNTGRTFEIFHLTNKGEEKNSATKPPVMLSERQKREAYIRQLTKEERRRLRAIRRILDNNPQIRVIQITSEQTSFSGEAVLELLKERNITLVFERLKKQGTSAT